MKNLKPALEILKQIVKFVFPKSRIGTAIAYVVGFLIANYSVISTLINAIETVFKSAH